MGEVLRVPGRVRRVPVGEEGEGCLGLASGRLRGLPAIHEVPPVLLKGLRAVVVLRFHIICHDN